MHRGFAIPHVKASTAEPAVSRGPRLAASWPRSDEFASEMLISVDTSWLREPENSGSRFSTNCWQRQPQECASIPFDVRVTASVTQTSAASKQWWQAQRMS